MSDEIDYDEFTPAWEAIKWGYRAALDGIRETGLEEADRWLAAHDAELRATALEEAADEWGKAGAHDGGQKWPDARRPAVWSAAVDEAVHASTWLRARAAAIREGGK